MVFLLLVHRHLRIARHRHGGFGGFPTGRRLSTPFCGNRGGGSRSLELDLVLEEDGRSGRQRRFYGAHCALIRLLQTL